MSVWDGIQPASRVYRLRPTHERAGRGDSAIAQALKRMWQPEEKVEKKSVEDAKLTIAITNHNRTVKLIHYKRLPSRMCISMEDGRIVTLAFEKDGTVEIEGNFGDGSEWISMPPEKGPRLL